MRQAVPWWRTLLGFVLFLVFLAVLGAMDLTDASTSTLATAATWGLGLLAGKAAVQHVAQRGGRDGSGS